MYNRKGEGKGGKHFLGLCHPLCLALGKGCPDHQDGDLAGGAAGDQDSGGALAQLGEPRQSSRGLDSPHHLYGNILVYAKL